jgi:hypothetical protein
VIFGRQPLPNSSRSVSVRSPGVFLSARRDRVDRCLRKAQTTRSSGSGVRLIGGINPEHGERIALDLLQGERQLIQYMGLIGLTHSIAVACLMIIGAFLLAFYRPGKPQWRASGAREKIHPIGIVKAAQYEVLGWCF